MKNRNVFCMIFLQLSSVIVFSMDYSHQIINIAPYQKTAVIYLCDKDAAKNLEAGDHRIEAIAIRIADRQCGQLIQKAKENMQPNGIKGIIEFVSSSDTSILKAVSVFKSEFIADLELNYRSKPSYPSSNDRFPYCYINSMKFMPLTSNIQVVENNFKGDDSGRPFYNAKGLVAAVVICALAVYNQKEAAFLLNILDRVDKEYLLDLVDKEYQSLNG